MQAKWRLTHSDNFPTKQPVEFSSESYKRTKSLILIRFIGEPSRTQTRDPIPRLKGSKGTRSRKLAESLECRWIGNPSRFRRFSNRHPPDSACALRLWPNFGCVSPYSTTLASPASLDVLPAFAFFLSGTTFGGALASEA